MRGFLSSVTSALATAAALVADENDEQLAAAPVSQAEVEFAEVCGWAGADADADAGSSCCCRPVGASLGTPSCAKSCSLRPSADAL